jgi:hypothetical protein
MTSILRFATAQKSPIYTALAKAAIARLTEFNRCSKEQMLKDANLGVLDADVAIHWEHVTHMVEAQMGVELMPMAASFFAKHKKEEEVQKPQRYMAQGAGKRTAGWAIVTEENGHFVVRKIAYKRNQTAGAAEATNRTFLAAQQAGVTKLSGEAYPHQLEQDLRNHTERTFAAYK